MRLAVSVAMAAAHLGGFLTTAASAEPITTVSGEVRIREEYRRHDYSPADPAGAGKLEFAHMRARLRVDADIDDHLAVVIELQDVRVLGEEGSTTADTEGTDLKRGAIIVRDIGDQPISLELGRYVMAYGDQRIIGHLEWVDQGRTYDGALLKVEARGASVDLFGARVREIAGAQELNLFGSYAGFSPSPVLRVEIYGVGLEDEQSALGEIAAGTTLFGTFGTRLVLAPDTLDGLEVTSETALQVGEVRGDDLLAWAAAIRAEYTLERAPYSPRVGLEFDYASGDGDPTDGEVRQFQTLFPTNHLHYGYADLASWENIVAGRLTLAATLPEAITVSLDVHHLRLADPQGGWVGASGATIRPGIAGASTHLGDEVDLVVGYEPVGGLALLGGWSYFHTGAFIDDTGGGDNVHFGYLQARAVF